MAINPEPKAVPADTTETPLEAAPAGADATGEYRSADMEPSGAATCDFPVAAPTAVPGTCDFAPASQFGTLDFQAPTEALLGAVPAAANPGDMTSEFSADGKPAPTAYHAPGGATQPAAPDTVAAANSPICAGRYVFKKFHAKGGMGEVWLAEDSDIGRPVALKRILKGRENHRTQFVKEARVTGQLEHPGVIPVHELSLDDNDQPYYVMKFVHGQTLAEVIETYHKSKINPAAPRERQWHRLLTVFVDLCQTIAYAHSRGVIHRDIKPDNVMVGAYGETLVLDWGLAKVVGEPESSDPMAAIQLSGADTVETLAGTVKGTPTYFAPEAATGKVAEVDQLSDVYLLGATLYDIITGKPPREGKKIMQLLEMARTTPPTPPRQVDPTVPKPLDAICRKAIAFKKADRYQSAAALAEDMESYLAGDPVSAYQENLLERTWRFVKKHRTALSRAAAAVVVLATMATAYGFIREAEIGRARAQAQADQLQAEENARQQIRDFRARLEEARFYAASANPVAEAIPGLDASQAEAKAAEALKIAAAWGPKLDKMPLAAERPALKNDLYDLLLELAQLKSRQDTKATQALLTRAASYQPPSRSYYRLRALCWQAEGDNAHADADLAQAKDPTTPALAMDYYLLGEQSRVASTRQAKDDVKEGKKAGVKGLVARRKPLQEAIGFYRQALRANPDHYWSHFQLAVCYGGLGSFAEAAESLGACIAINPNAPWGYSSRGLALSQIKDRVADAEADLDKARELDPSFRPVRLHRAVFYATQKRYKQADAAFAEILPPVDPAPLPQAYLARGQMYMFRPEPNLKSGEQWSMFKEAIADFEKVAAGPRPVREVYLHLTRCYLMEGELDKALDALGSYLKTDMIDAKPFQLHERRARELRKMAAELGTSKAVKLRSGVLRLALSELNKAIELGGNTASLYDELGSTQELLGRLKDAVTAYSRAISLAPESEGALIKRGWAYVNLQQEQKARNDFARAVKIVPGNAEAHAGLGYADAVLKAPGSARVQANLAVLNAGNYYLVLHNTACIYGALIQSDAARANEYEDLALAHLQRAVELWKQDGKRSPNEIDLIAGESAFPASLRARPEFKKLLQKNP